MRGDGVPFWNIFLKAKLNLLVNWMTILLELNIGTVGYPICIYFCGLKMPQQYTKVLFVTWLLMTVLKIWLMFGGHGREKFIKVWIIQNDTQSNVFLGNFAHTFWFWHLKASVMSIFFFFFFRFLRFYDQIWPKIPVLELHIFWQCNLEYEKTAVMLLIIDIFWH